jgi:prophage tail gpP-like protein
MSVFDAKSRYARYATVYQTTDARGRMVAAVSAPALPDRPTLGDHLLKEHQRLDHLAGHYLANANGFWSIAHHNGRLLPDAALAAPSVKIPREG